MHKILMTAAFLLGSSCCAPAPHVTHCEEGYMTPIDRDYAGQGYIHYLAQPRCADGRWEPVQTGPWFTCRCGTLKASK